MTAHDEDRGGRGGGKAWLVLASYLVLFAALTREWLLAAATSAPAGNHPNDARLVVWILAWVASALTSRPLELFDAPIFSPAPAQLTGSEHFLSSQIVFLPLHALTGNPVLAANAVVWLSYPLAAFAMERLLVASGFSRSAAWASGLFFALGPMRVPASLQVLQLLNAYFPLVAVALHRLRDVPTTSRAATVTVLLALAAFSSYYLAAMTAIVALVWGAVELCRPGFGRVRFVVLAALAGLAVSAALAAFSLPYFERQPAPAMRPSQEGGVAATGVAEQNARSVPWSVVQPLVWPADRNLVLALAAIGLAAGMIRGLGSTALAGLAFILFGAGSLVWLVAAGGMSDEVAAWLGFFRHAYRTQALTNFGAALLVAAGLEGCRRVLGRRAGILVALAASVAVTYQQGSALLAPGLDRIALPRPDASSYHEIGRIARRAGGGAALELPVTDRGGADLRPRGMLGALHHGLPLVSGFSGHFAGHFLVVNSRVRRLPAAGAVDDLVDLARLRWIVLRPVRDWPSAEERERYRTALAALQGVAAFETGDFTLLSIERPVRHPAWFDAIASGRGLRSLPLHDRRHLEPWAVREKEAPAP